MKKGICLLLLFTFSLAYGQEISEKKEIAVFRLNHRGWDLPEGALASIDQELLGVFINLGRFDVLGITHRLGQADVTEFAERIKEFKQENVEIPEEFKMGQEIFTEKEMNRLIGSFIVVIPAVTFFNVEEKERQLITGKKVVDYTADIKTSFTFINVAEVKTFAQFFVETSGSEDSRQAAIQDAVDNIPMRLEFEITKIPEFTLKTGVLETRGSEVVVELGRDMGIRKGYEFIILSSQILESGRMLDSEKGLLVVKEVGEEISLAKIIYGDPAVGDQLKEVPRLGLDSTPYLHVMADPFAGFELYSQAGVRVVGSKGFYEFRPVAILEVPLPIGPDTSLIPWMWAFGFPFSVYVGGEMTLYWGRLQLTPQVTLGAGYIVPWLIETEDPVFTHMGGMVAINLTYLFSRDMKASVDVGFKQWFGIWDRPLIALGLPTASYGGFVVGGGVTFKL